MSFGSRTSTGPYRRRTRSWSGSTPRLSTDRTAAGAKRSRSSPATSPVCCGRSGRSSAWSSPERSRPLAHPSASSRSETTSSESRALAHTRSSCALRRMLPLARKPAGMSFEEAAAVSDGAIIALACLQKRRQHGAEHSHLRRLRFHRNGSSSAGQALRSRRHSRLQHEEPRARGIARGRSGHRLHAGRLHQER